MAPSRSETSGCSGNGTTGSGVRPLLRPAPRQRRHTGHHADARLRQRTPGGRDLMGQGHTLRVGDEGLRNSGGTIFVDHGPSRCQWLPHLVLGCWDNRHLLTGLVSEIKHWRLHSCRVASVGPMGYMRCSISLLGNLRTAILVEFFVFRVVVKIIVTHSFSGQNTAV